MREFDRSEVVVSHDDAYAEVGNGPQLLGEVMRHANAAVRGRITRQHAFVQRHPRPGDALHVRHRRIAVEIGVVIAVLLDDAEDARWRRTAGTPVDTGPCATRTPLLKSVTFWLPIETTICRGPFGIWPKPTSFFLGSAFSFFVVVGATRALRAGIAAGGAYQPSYQP